MWGRATKVGQAETLAAVVRQTALPTIVGMDLNDPKSERWDPIETKWWPEILRDFFDPAAPHGCIDVLYRWYAANP